MHKINPSNAKAIYLYQNGLKHVRGYDTKTIDAALRYIWQFDRFTGSLDFRNVERAQIVKFKDNLVEHRGEDGKPRSPSTIVHTFGALRSFFEWLGAQEGYRRSIPADLPPYFSAPLHLVEMASAAAPKVVPTIDQLRSILGVMPADMPTQRRDRAMIAALFLFGVRDGALITLRLKHVDIERKRVFQDAREVKTKFSRTSMVDWFPLGEDLETIVIEWVRELRSLGADDDAPLIPKTPFKPWLGYKTIELDFLTSANTVRDVLKAATAAAGVPYFKPHALRSTVARLFDDWALSTKEMKALSQNMSHKSVLTTFRYYGDLEDEDKHAVINAIRDRQKNPRGRSVTDRLANADSHTLDLVENLLNLVESRRS